MRSLCLQMTALALGLFGMIALVGCSPAATRAIQADSPARLRILATTTIVADVVRVVGGETIELSVLLPVGVDPHGFEPTPRDIAALAQADAIFVNGAGLETFLQPLLAAAGGNARVVPLTDDIPLIQGEANNAQEQETVDPHVWTDPNNVLIWTQSIAGTLGELDPAHADTFETNARQYNQKLVELDGWIVEQVSQIPPENRKLVTDHTIFAYFARRYGLTQVGALIPGASTLAESSARELADLEDKIRDLGVKAIFVGDTISSGLAARVAEDTGIRVVFLYTDSLTQPGGEAGNYLDYMAYNVQAIVEALK